MGQVIGQLLPLALGVALSPIPIIAVILMLLAPKATAAGIGFLGGWIVGIVSVTVVVVLLTSGMATSSSSSTSGTVSGVKLVLGVVLLLLAGRQWRSRPAPGETAALPKWMSAIDTLTPIKALGLGFVLAAANPKNLTLSVAAGITIGSTSLDPGQRSLSIIIFCIIAASSVAVPVIAYLVARERMQPSLSALHSWLLANNATIMAVLLLVLGVVLIGKGIGRT